MSLWLGSSGTPAVDPFKPGEPRARLPLLSAASTSMAAAVLLASASIAASIAFLLRFSCRESLQAQVMIVMINVAIAVPKTTATAMPELLRVLSRAMKTLSPALSVVQYMPSAQELEVAVDMLQAMVPEVAAQVE